MPGKQWEHPNRPAVRRFPPRLRRMVLKRDRICQLGYHGCTELSTEVDHVVGWADAQALGWHTDDIDDVVNAQGVCRTCHRTKSAAEATRGKARMKAKGRTNQRPPKRHHGLKDNNK